LSEPSYDQYTGHALESVLPMFGTPISTNSLSKYDLVGELYYATRNRFSDEDSITELVFDLGGNVIQVLAVDGIIQFDVRYPTDIKF
jgi:hypothetical protein